jgi:hypothetical protein
LYELVTVSESVIVFIPTILPSVFDSVIVSENIQVVVVTLESLSETITVSENLAFDTIIWVYEPKEYAPRGDISPLVFGGSPDPSIGISAGGSAF